MNADNKKYKFVYQTTNLVNGKIYIGVHSTNNLNDGYIGCGCRSMAYAKASLKYGFKSAFLSAVEKYGYKSFRRDILSFYDTYKECIEEEEYIVTYDWVMSNSNYNIKIGGINNNYHLTGRTIEFDESVYKDFMLGMKKKEICLKYSIGESVVYNILKIRDTSKRIKPLQSNSIKIKNWIKNNGDNYREIYRDRKMTKTEIGKIVPFDLYKNDFLKDVVQIDRYYYLKDGEKITFDDIYKLGKDLNVGFSRSGFLNVVNGTSNFHKNFKFYKNDKK